MQFKRFVWVSLGLAGLSLMLLVGNTLSLRLFGQIQQIDVGNWGDQNNVAGGFEQEQNALGETYRWTQAEATIRLQGYGSASSRLLSLKIGGVPSSLPVTATMQVSTNSASVALPLTQTARHYHLLIPPTYQPDWQVRLNIPTQQVLPDPRFLGVRLDHVQIQTPSIAWSSVHWHLLIVQLAIMSSLIGVLWFLAADWPTIVGISGITILVLVTITGKFVLVAWAWQLRLLIVAAATTLLVGWLRSLIQNQIKHLLKPYEYRYLIIFSVISFFIPVMSILFPNFGSHDRVIHADRLGQVAQGSALLLDKLYEFQGRETITPTTFYLLALPLTVFFNNNGLIIEGLYTFLHASSGILLAITLLRWKVRPILALAAMILISAMPIQMTILWWGFAPQIVGQWLILVFLAVFSFQSTLRPTIISIGILSLAIWMHNGVALLAGTWIASYCALGYWRDPAQRRHYWAWFLNLIGISIFGLLAIYIDLFMTTGTTQQQVLGLTEYLPAVINGLSASFAPIGIMFVAIFGLLPFLQLEKNKKILLIASGLTFLLFLAIDIVFGVQVRYSYFILPFLLMIGIIFIDQRLSIIPYVESVIITLTLLCYGYSLYSWYDAIIYGVKPSLLGLTH
ncbi:MAG TPA: hypothetical protein DEF47_17195 [Herpetosiphon sp.]|uniref:Uncharacterized protein n=1 Tax=Herpetosiphon aurantiacus (strain ATCC 23779 / DSM 785 / 114-95) TaxID=316274 RepID=A9B284_HERA2|nr:hypothetical protein [Herpetosiphon sp.]ABX07434.1 hypothetical protein Haur_4803 [Herpetosiphon aurantiacus DSM 785]HBW51631.1 hypothetical protein [Herpetosiphon sp.]